VRLFILLCLALCAGAATFFAPRFAQPLWYHDFADQRTLINIPHALNVLSNLPFVIVGVWGVCFLLTPAARRPGGAFIHSAERWPYFLFFAGVALTGVGSAYYHADPNNARLLWDRLPLAIAFMALFAALLGERLHRKAGLALFVPLALAGAGSVVYWHLSEIQGAGDLRPYLFVQLFPLAAVPLLLLLFPARYTRSADLFAGLLCYVLAKGLELLDAQIYGQGQLVSGHTLKHLAAGLSAWWILHMLKHRRPVACQPASAPTPGSQAPPGNFRVEALPPQLG
jgi:hypothetical protein